MYIYILNYHFWTMSAAEGVREAKFNFQPAFKAAHSSAHDWVLFKAWTFGLIGGQRIIELPCKARSQSGVALLLNIRTCSQREFVLAPVVVKFDAHDHAKREVR